MIDDIKVNGYPVIISVSHVTEPGEGWKGTTLVAVCYSMVELNEVLNLPKNQPEPYWQWRVDFEDKVEDNDPS